jgi:hypothetical protein
MLSLLLKSDAPENKRKKRAQTHGRGNIIVIEKAMTRYDMSPRHDKKSSPNKGLFL